MQTDLQEAHEVFKKILALFMALFEDDHSVFYVKLLKYPDIVDAILAGNIAQAESDIVMLARSMAYTVATYVSKGCNSKGSKFEGFDDPILTQALKMDVTLFECLKFLQKITKIIQP